MSLPSVSRPVTSNVAALALAFLFLAAGSAASVAGQLVDRGTFRILEDGREVGREEFTIQRLGTGDAQTTLARGAISMRDGRELETILQVVGPELILVEYSAKETGPDTASISLARAGDRFQARTMTEWGEKVRGYRARPATFVLDEGVAHHYFVLGRFTARDTIQQTLYAFSRVSEGLEPIVVLNAAPESLELGGERIEATRIQFGDGDGAGTAWFDGSGRLMRVSLPGKGFVAERDLRPRGLN